MNFRLIFITVLVVLFIGSLVGLYFICSCEDKLDDHELMAAREKKKIRVVMFCTPNYRDRGQAGVDFMRDYAKKHGYEFKLYEDQLLDDLHVNFTKMKIMEQETKRNDVDFTVMSDADITGKRMDIPLENIVAMSDLGDERVVGMPKDVVWGGKYLGKWVNMKQDSPYNSGFMVAKNCPDASEVFSHWIESAKGECSEEAKRHPNDQLVMKKCLLPKYGHRITNVPWQVAGLPGSMMMRHNLSGDRPGKSIKKEPWF